MASSFAEQVIPASDVILVSPAATPLPGGPCRALLIGSAGNINLTTTSGNERDDVPVPAGVVQIQCTHVRTGAAAVAASNIWAMY
jgi:hypothetical protein